MQEPGSPRGSSLPPSRPKRRRQRRTVYSAQQRRELEAFFENNRRPTYRERETLAAKLNLPEDKLQVWFKNRRAKYRRLLGPPRKQGSSLRPKPPRRRRQQRTLYSAEQRRELEAFFENNHHPTYQERETLAARLNLQEYKVQVWFKNRRAKYRKLLRLARQQGPGDRAEPQGPGVGAPAGPVFPSVPGFTGGAVSPPGEPVVSPGPGFCSLSQPSPCGLFPEAEPSASSHRQAWWDPAQGTQNLVPAAPAPAPAPAENPVWPQGHYASNFSSDPAVTRGFAELCSVQDPLEGPSFARPGYLGFVDDSDPDSKTLLDL